MTRAGSCVHVNTSNHIIHVYDGAFRCIIINIGFIVFHLHCKYHVSTCQSKLEE